MNVILPSPLLVTGATGQVGRALLRALGKEGIGVERKALDFSQQADEFAKQSDELLSAVNPSALLNAAAYTSVDNAENEGREEAFRVNAAQVGLLGEVCRRHGIPLVHYSTDYVFNGTGSRPWRETDTPTPLNAYGQSKLAGEQALEAAGGRYLIFRTSWVYDGQGKNFLTTMLRLGREREELSVVADQCGAPTYAPHLAEATLSALERALKMPEFPSGIYHLCHAGETSWHGFAEAIFAEARRRGETLKVQRVVPISTKEYPTPARRSFNSRLDCSKAGEVLGVTLPAWQEGLSACMHRRYADS